MFEKWYKTTTFEELRELILLEDFKTCLPEGVLIHLNERKVTSLLDAAVLSDEFVLMHRNVLPSVSVFLRCLIIPIVVKFINSSLLLIVYKC